MHLVPVCSLIKSLRQLVVDFFGIGMIVDDFRQGGIRHWDREWLKMWVKTSASWSAQSLNTLTMTEKIFPLTFLMLLNSPVVPEFCSLGMKTETALCHCDGWVCLV